MLNLSHKKLKVWQKSIELVKYIYELTSNYPREEQFTLTSQIRRASISIPSNIAEGASRISSAEKKRFFEISRSSLVELDTHLEISIKLNYCDENDLLEIDTLNNEIFAMLTKLMGNLEVK